MTTTPTTPTTAKRLLLAVAIVTILVVTATAVAATQPADDYDPDDVPGALTDIDSRLDSLELSAEARYGHAVRTRGIADAASQDVRYLEADLDALTVRLAELEHTADAMASGNMICEDDASARYVIEIDWDSQPPSWRAFPAQWIDCGDFLKYRRRSATYWVVSGFCTHSLHDPVDAALFEEHPRTAVTTDSCVGVYYGTTQSALWFTDADGWHRHLIDEHGDLPEMN